MASRAAGFAGRAFANGVRAVRLADRRLDRMARSRALWLVIPFGTELGEQSRPTFGGNADIGLSHLDLLRSLERVATDQRISGVLLRFQGTGPHRFSQAAALRRRLDHLRSWRRVCGTFFFDLPSIFWRLNGHRSYPFAV